MIRNVKEVTDLKFGGKAYGLNKLNKLNVTVPEAYAIDQVSINEIIADDKAALAQLNLILNEFDTNATFAIRSSAANEDGKEKSFAGMYDTILNVPNNLSAIVEAIKKVNNSLESERLNSYNETKSKMNIVLQLMILPKIAGVCFTNAIDLNGQDVIYIEYVEGIGESLVSGKKTAKSVVVSLNDYSYRCEENSDKELFKSMIKCLKSIKEQTNEELDLEWCIDSDGKPFFLQARPITKQVIIREKMSTGAIASPGNCSGEIYVIDEDSEDEVIEKRINDFPKGAILLAKTTDTNYVPAMKKASGIITTEGSVLSHAAIIAREFSIPCITGFKSALDLFEDGKKISIDTNNKSIIYDGKKIAFGNGKEINLLELYTFNNIQEEKIDGYTVLVESIDNEFGIHIDEELDQSEIDKIEIYIRKKYGKPPVILKDQKYLWYKEFSRFKKFPNYIQECKEAERICKNFKIEEVNKYVNSLLLKVERIFNNISSEYEKAYAGEYAQAIHFLINLYMCNGCGMKAIYDYMKKNEIKSVQEILSSNTVQSRFLKKIEEIRGSIWEIFVKKGWSSDDYYDERDELIMAALNEKVSNEETIDAFYDSVKEYNNQEISVKKK